MAVYRNDADAAQFRAEQLARELAETQRALAVTKAALADEIAKRPLATNVALEVMALVGFLFGILGVVYIVVSGRGAFDAMFR